MLFLLELAWRDLRASGRGLWIFVACIVLGVSLVTAGGGLYRLIADGLRQDAKLLFGGDAEVELSQPLPDDALAWMAQHGAVSRVIELRTMLRTDTGRAHLVELQSANEAYPLVGRVELEPAASLADALALRDGRWGAAIDGTLARRLDLRPGQRVAIGDLDLVVRAILLRQPDRSLRADWGAAPVLVAEGALIASGLVQLFSRVEYRYRVRIDAPGAPSPSAWRDGFIAAFPGVEAEVRSVDEHSNRVVEVVAQIGSGLLLIGLSALFIGGLGVFNSVQAYLQGKLASLATLRALGLRDARLAAFVLMQILLLAGLASVVGAIGGVALAMAGAQLVADKLPMTPTLQALWSPTLTAVLFGVLTALAFSLPALGRALAVSPAVLFRGEGGPALHTPRKARWLTTAVGTALVVLVVAALPDPHFGLAFVAATVALLALLDAATRGLRFAAERLQHHAPLALPLRLALAGLHQPGSPLRTALLSLGSALTLLVACALVVATLLRMVNDTVPRQAPALVFHDVQTEQIALLRETLQASPGLQAVRTAPLVLGRLDAVNGEFLRESGDRERARESHDEHKFSNREGNFDDVVVARGAWWPAEHRGEPLVAMEDREADQLGLQVGDRLRFRIMDQPVEARLTAIYSQRRMQARLWLEAIFSDGVLDPYITRHVGAAWMPADQALAAQDRLAAAAPNIATARTESLLRETRALLGRASVGLGVVAGVCLAASLLVLASVVAASRSRQLYDATVMHVLGARLALLRSVLVWEYLLLGIATAGFAVLAGGTLATALLQWRLDMSPAGLYWTGLITALACSTLSLGLGAQILLAQMRLNPARLLRSGG